MSLPFLVKPESKSANFAQITPQFPNWQKSFVSGPDSPLFVVEHFIHSVRPTLLLSRVNFHEKAEGPPGCVHGGASAGLIDEVMGVAAWHSGAKSVTQKLELHYGKLLPLNEEAMIFTEIVSMNPKTLEIHSTVYTKNETPCVSAQGVFHRLSNEQLALFAKSKS